MNPVDHPHGGGEGYNSTAHHPVTPWGFPIKEVKTRWLSDIDDNDKEKIIC